jgi:predicted nucleic acid-binding protein
MLYFDTSFLAPLILEEAASADVERFMAALPTGILTVSHWTRVEFSSLLAREVRMGALDPAVARDADAQFETLVAESFIVLLPNENDYICAKEFLQKHETGLRAGDALHLAIAGNRRADSIFTLDKTMVRAGKALGLPVSAGINHG